MTEVQPYDQQEKRNELNVNRYATKKTIAQGMLDIALLTANASQLKYVLQTNGHHPFYTLMLVLIGLSIALQVVAGLLALTMNVLQDCRLHILENPSFLIGLTQLQLTSSFCVTGINVLISAFDPAFVTTVGISILYIGTLNINKAKHYTRANILNNLITIQIFIISVVNIIITAFGIEQVNIVNAEMLKKQEARMHEASRLVSSNRSVMIFDEAKI